MTRRKGARWRFKQRPARRNPDGDENKASILHLQRLAQATLRRRPPFRQLGRESLGVVVVFFGGQHGFELIDKGLPDDGEGEGPQQRAYVGEGAREGAPAGAGGVQVSEAHGGDGDDDVVQRRADGREGGDLAARGGAGATGEVGAG